MTKLLEQAIAEVRKLSAADQNMAAELLLSLVQRDSTPYRLTREQIEEVKLAIAEADRGEFATEEEMAALWKKCGQ